MTPVNEVRNIDEVRVRIISQMQSLKVHYPGLVVALSGGVDSSLLLWSAREVYSRERVLAVTVISPLHPPEEIKAAIAAASFLDLPHRLVEVNLLALPEVINNHPDRCYYCKRKIIEAMLALAQPSGWAVAEGSNADDLKDYRPGLKAVKEMGVFSPLAAAGVSKEEIRLLARYLCLPSADRPPNPCLATRFPYGTVLSEEKLMRVAVAERFLREAGLKVVRVRCHGDLARIETDPQTWTLVMEKREEISRYFHHLGFSYVALDLTGYRSGSMNREQDSP